MILNESKLVNNWKPVIESTVGDVERSKLGWMSKALQIQENYETARANGSLNENNFFATKPSVNGMGAVELPAQPGNGWNTGDTGSGDVPYSLLPLAIQVAAQTIGLELVPVIPMNGPVGMLPYMDFVYAGGKDGYGTQNSLYAAGTNGKGVNAPIYIKAELDGYAGVTKNATYTIPAGTTSGETLSIEYLGQSRIDGYAIFKLPETLVDGNGTEFSVADAIPAGTTAGSGITVTGATSTEIISKAELVKGLEDHIQGFTTNRYDSTSAMARLEGETTPDNTMNITLFSKSVEAKTVQAAAAVTREQVQDLRQFGIDAVAQVNQILANELTQSINKDILGEIFALGKENHANITATQGVSFHLVLGATTATLTVGTDAAVSTEDWLYFGAGTSVQQVDAVNTGAENLSTRQRRLMSRLLAVSNIISTIGRRGPASFAVCSAQTASALQDCAGFVPAPMANTINQVAGALYPIGTLAGLAIYVDPNMAWGDGRIAVGRKGDGQTPGLVFMPYIMADTVETIAEGTMAPKIAIKSRYALVRAGHHPETMYLTFGVSDLVDVYWA